jgi:hypothetical protein
MVRQDYKETILALRSQSLEALSRLLENLNGLVGLQSLKVSKKIMNIIVHIEEVSTITNLK